MRKATCRISVTGSTFEEIETKVRKEIKEFLQLSDEKFEEVYKSLELTILVEKASPERADYFGDSSFTIPSFQ